MHPGDDPGRRPCRRRGPGARARRTTRALTATALGVVAALTAAACSGGGSTAAVRRPGTTTTSGPAVLDEKIVAAPATGDAANRFTLSDGTTVLVPVGAVSKGAEVRVRRAAEATVSQGAMEAGPSTYEITVTTGSILKPIAVQIAVPDAPDRTTAVAVGFDVASGTWAPVNSDSSSGSLTIYASKPGTYAWVRWNWETAAEVAAQTVRAVLGSQGADGLALTCTGGAAVAARYTMAGASGEALRWCFTTASGSDGLQATNEGAGPLSLRSSGLLDASTTRRRPLTDSVMDVVRQHWTVATGGALELLAPGDRVAFGLSSTSAGQAGLVSDGLSQFYDALAGALAFTAGLYAGTPAVGAAVVDDDAVRNAVLRDLNQPGCADTAVAAFAAPQPAADVAAAVEKLMTRCLSPDTVLLAVGAAGKRSPLRAAFAPTTGSLPDTARRFVGPALLGALEPVLAAGPGGDVTASPAGTPAGATPRAPEGATPVTVPPTLPAPSTSTLVTLAPTTLATVPPVPTTAAGATTTTQATTTTTGAPATTTTTTTTVKAAPVLALSSRSCSRLLGSIQITGSGLTPGGPYTLSITGPSRGGGTVTGSATAGGAMSYPFNCTLQPRGSWTVRLTDGASGLSATGVTFTVN